MDQVGKVREKIDIVSLISEYIPLKRAGRNFKANCPFHNEKTASFVVSPERQIWHCFGCSKGGDCFTFLMEYDKMEFPEALRILAKKAGVELVEASSWQSGVSSKKEKIYKLNKLALDFYHFLLTKHRIGKKGLEYLEKRKITKASIENFKIGFAPKINNGLSNYLIQKKKFKKEDLIDAGLVNQRGQMIVDFFIDRIIFPLFDHRGNVIGFSGRIFQSEDLEQAKYVNTRETLVYHKGDVFFGLNIAKEEIKKEDKVIITEGEFDVISAFQEGVKNIIAVKGSALTESQANLLSRFTKNIILGFDTDKAGQEALKRSLAILEKKELIVWIINILGKDIDEAVRENPIEFKKSLKNTLSVYDDLFSKTLHLLDKKTVDGKRKITDELLPIFSAIGNEIVKEHFFKKLAVELDVSFETVLKEAEKKTKKEIQIKTNETKEKRPRTEILEEYILALIFQAENITGVVKELEKLAPFLPKESSRQKILALLLDFVKNKEESANYKKIVEILPLELLPVFDQSFLFPLTKFKDEDEYVLEIKKIINELKELYLKNKIKLMTQQIKEKEEISENGKLKKQKEELGSLIKLLQN